MYPFYKNGERIFCLKPFFFNEIELDDTIIFNHEKEGMMIKQVTKINEKGYYVEGTTPYSVDSSIFGYLKKKKFCIKFFLDFN